MRPRWLRTASTVCTLLLLQGCSSTRFAYNNATWFVVRQATRAFCPDASQRAALKGLVGDLLQWHRRHELPRYARSLRELQRALERPLTHAAFRAVVDALDQARARLSARAAEPLVRLAMSAGPAQAACLAAALSRQHVDTLAELRRSAYADRELDKHARRLRDWLGGLDASQRALIARLLPSRDEALAVARARLSRSLRLVHLLRQGPGEPKRKSLHAVLMDPYALFATDEAKLLRRHHASNASRFWQVAQTLSATQRAHLARKVGQYASDFEVLSRQ